MGRMLCVSHKLRVNGSLAAHMHRHASRSLIYSSHYSNRIRCIHISSSITHSIQHPNQHKRLCAIITLSDTLWWKCLNYLHRWLHNVYNVQCTHIRSCQQFYHRMNWTFYDRIIIVHSSDRHSRVIVLSFSVIWISSYFVHLSTTNGQSIAKCTFNK